MNEPQNIALLEWMRKISDDITDVKQILSTQSERQKNITERVEKVEAELKPIRRHVVVVQGVGGLLTALGIIVGILSAIGVFR